MLVAGIASDNRKAKQNRHKDVDLMLDSSHRRSHFVGEVRGSIVRRRGGIRGRIRREREKSKRKRKKRMRKKNRKKKLRNRKRKKNRKKKLRSRKRKKNRKKKLRSRKKKKKERKRKKYMIKARNMEEGGTKTGEC